MACSVNESCGSLGSAIALSSPCIRILPFGASAKHALEKSYDSLGSATGLSTPHLGLPLSMHQVQGLYQHCYYAVGTYGFKILTDKASGPWPQHTILSYRVIYPHLTSTSAKTGTFIQTTYQLRYTETILLWQQCWTIPLQVPELSADVTWSHTSARN